MERYVFEIRCAWDGTPLLAGERASIELSLGDRIELAIDASFHGDPPPAVAPGRCDGLWEFEVVELFLLGDDDRYLELELGPHGHWLALALAGRRRIAASDLALTRCEFDRGASHWSARAEIPRSLLPPGLAAANAYAIHGIGAARRHLAWQPVPGPAPDFHRLDCFAPLARAAQRGGLFRTG